VIPGAFFSCAETCGDRAVSEKDPESEPENADGVFARIARVEDELVADGKLVGVRDLNTIERFGGVLVPETGFGGLAPGKSDPADVFFGKKVPMEPDACRRKLMHLQQVCIVVFISGEGDDLRRDGLVDAQREPLVGSFGF